jgi:PKD domain
MPGSAGAVAPHGVRVTINGGPAQYLTHAKLLEVGSTDIGLTPYTERSGGPDTDTLIEWRGTSAKRLVELTGVGLPALIDMSVSAAGYPTVTINADEVTNGFFGDPRPPNPHFAVFDPNSSAPGTAFFRPLRSSDESHTDRVEAPETDLNVNLRTKGRLLHVSLAADRTKINHGQRVTFTARATPATSGTVTYAWDFEGADDPVTNHLASDSHVYAADGTYSAKVTVTAEDGSSGTDSTVITVGTPSSGGSNDGPTSPGGSLGGGGKAGGGGKSKNGGGTAGSKAPNSGPKKGKKKNTTRNRRSPQTAPGSGGTGGSTGSQGSDTGGTSSTTNGTSGSKRSAAENVPTHGKGSLISGILLADSTAFRSALPALTRSTQQAIERSAARASAGSPGGVLAWVAGGGLCLAILISGATLEFRPLARLLTRQP